MARIAPETAADKAVRRLVQANLDVAGIACRRIEHGRDGAAMHELRVSLRRLRVALRAYAPFVAAGVPHKLRRRLRAVSHATGDVRDAEVQLEWIDSLRPGAGVAQRPGRRWVRAQLAARRRTAVRRVRQAALPEFRQLDRRIRHRLGQKALASCGKGSAARAGFAGAAAPHVRRHIAVLAGQLGRIGSVRDMAGAHAARITAKQLRYLIEPLVRGKEADAVIGPLRELQDSLGKLHDRQVMARTLARLRNSGARKEPDGDLMPGLRWLALRNREEAAMLHEKIRRRYLDQSARTLLRSQREFVRRLTAGFTPIRMEKH